MTEIEYETSEAVVVLVDQHATLLLVEGSKYREVTASVDVDPEVEVVVKDYVTVAVAEDVSSNAKAEVTEEAESTYT